MFRSYLQLTKPGIVVGNLISVTGGFLLASQGNINWFQGFLVTLSVALVVASGCIINNVIDRDIDCLMKRTCKRPTVTGEVSVNAALSCASVLGVSGATLLYCVTPGLLPVCLVLAGLVVYVGLYSLHFKRSSVHGTLIGSFSGAVPPVVGYCSVGGGFDAAALTLLVMFSLWQMPHSYAIAIFRAGDYGSASIPVLPVVRGIPIAKRHIAAYIVAFTGATLALGILGYVGTFYMLVAFFGGVYWFGLAVAGWTTNNDRRWAKEIFFTSIVLISLLSAAMSLDYYRPQASRGSGLQTARNWTSVHRLTAVMTEARQWSLV
ncbi:protoheme IX farnesyltransferase [Paraburkholderia hospita]|uniref:Protoheme IX farnesyltransferase n=1 Tax=Paraburkholderia hospita TaxID=169430 RepID=A0ABN0F609_9BURK|nr:heme o synthase [Paraburkholderia hospita]EIM94059.1 protoheme IX farnesyltransferase [Paraburkholderia hospita]OUL77890.1 protoheme IX farnesyltransferase [Paraburkholderia hospita]